LQATTARTTVLALAATMAAFVLAASRANAQSAGDANAGKTQFGAQCAGCHSLSAAAQTVGPHLDGVVGRQAGSVAGFAYSAGMKQAAFRWTPARLDTFLANPSGVVPGTTMPVSVQDKKARADIIAYLATESRK
jgi:cytochrome c